MILVDHHLDSVMRDATLSEKFLSQTECLVMSMPEWGVGDNPVAERVCHPEEEDVDTEHRQARRSLNHDFWSQNDAISSILHC